MHPYTFHVSVYIFHFKDSYKYDIHVREIKTFKVSLFHFYLINLNISYSKYVFDPYQLVAICTSWSLNIDVQESTTTLVRDKCLLHCERLPYDQRHMKKNPLPLNDIQILISFNICACWIWSYYMYPAHLIIKISFHFL